MTCARYVESDPSRCVVQSERCNVRVGSVRAALCTMDNNGATMNGAVARAFGSVRIVEANVCVGGAWLAPPKVGDSFASRYDCAQWRRFLSTPSWTHSFGN
jgi:hypothetical protein